MMPKRGRTISVHYNIGRRRAGFGLQPEGHHGQRQQLTGQGKEETEEGCETSVSEIRACPERHRSPLLLHCLEDYLAGQRLPLHLVRTDISVTEPAQE